MNRAQALAKASELAVQLNIGPTDFKQAASFEVDSNVQTFVELEAGGKQAFAQMIEDSYYAPYQWTVRHFKEQDKHELLMKFKPDGTLYGFIEAISENAPGAALDLESALDIAQKVATASPWNINLSEYHLVEPSKETRPSGRIDYQFTYERNNALIGKGTYRLRLVVSGDRVTEITHSVKIPEEFTLRYQEMRSANNSIAAAANMVYLLLYILGGCMFGLFFLMRRNWIIWRPAGLWALIIAMLHALVNINQLPLSWMHYHTALSMHGFILNFCMAIIFQFLYMSIFYGIIFIAAESLSRAAFGHQPQFWHVWNNLAAHSQEIFGRTIGGYLLVPICLAFIIVFYMFTSSYFDWWIPSASLIDPDILATYCPWLSCLVLSLGAGFMEECLFRAIPISCAALIGKRLGNRRLWLVIGFIVQALIFGAAHANYAAQPAYARVIELLFFSILQGCVFLRFGLLPAIITHFTYDVVLMSLPLFISNAPCAWLNRGIIIILTLIPFLIVIRACIKRRGWATLSPEWLNESWKPALKYQREEQEPDVQKTKTFSRHAQMNIISLGLIGLILVGINFSLNQDGLSLNITRTDALHHAKNILEDRGVDPTSWFALPTIADDEKDSQEQQLQNQFIWQEGSPKLYHELLGSYLNPARWYIRLTAWNGSVSDRAEEHIISVISDGTLYRSYHKLPENTSSKSLDEDQARVIARAGLQSIFNLDAANLKEISAVATKHPERKDWTFTYENPAVQLPKGAQARNVIAIAGDAVIGGYSYVHVPEEWERKQLNHKNIFKIISLACLLFLLCMLGLGMIYAAMRNKRLLLLTHTTLFFCITVFFLGLAQLINSWPELISSFTTSEPFYHQAFSCVGLAIIGLLFKAGALGVLLALLTAWKKPHILTHKHPWFWGICLGIFSSGVIALLQTMQRHYEPLWADYSSMAHYMPAVTLIFQAVISFFALSVLLMIICIAIDALSIYGHKKPWILGIFCACLGLALAGRMNPENIELWLTIALVLAILLLILYLAIGRYSNKALVWTSATITGFYYLQQAAFNAYPGAIIGNLTALCAVIGAAFFWSIRIQE